MALNDRDQEVLRKGRKNKLPEVAKVDLIEQSLAKLVRKLEKLREGDRTTE